MAKQHLEAVAELKQLSAQLRREVSRYRTIRDKLTDTLYDADIHLRAVQRDIQKLELATDTMDEDARRKLLHTISNLRSSMESVFAVESPSTETPVEHAKKEDRVKVTKRPATRRRDARQSRRITLNVEKAVNLPIPRVVLRNGEEVKMPHLKPQLNSKGEATIHTYAARLISASVNREEGLPRTPQEAAFTTWGREWADIPIRVTRGPKDVYESTVGEDLKNEDSFLLSWLGSGLSNLANAKDPNVKPSSGLLRLRKSLEDNGKLLQAFQFGTSLGVIR